MHAHSTQTSPQKHSCETRQNLTQLSQNSPLLVYPPAFQTCAPSLFHTVFTWVSSVLSVLSVSTETDSPHAKTAASHTSSALQRLSTVVRYSFFLFRLVLNPFRPAPTIDNVAVFVIFMNYKRRWHKTYPSDHPCCTYCEHWTHDQTLQSCVRETLLS